MDVKDTAALLTDGFRPAQPPELYRFTNEVDGEDAREFTILAGVDSPAPGFTSYGTCDLSEERTNVTAEDGREIRTELVLAGRSSLPEFSDVLAFAAFAIGQGSVHVMPHTILPDAVKEAAPGHDCHHLMFVVPFLWPNLTILTDNEPEDGMVTSILQAVPITPDELHFAAAHGPEALFTALDDAGADVSVLDRPSVVPPQSATDGQP